MARRSKPALVDELDRALRLDARLRDITAERDTTRQRVNELSKQVGQLRKFGDDAGAEALMAESRALGDGEAALAIEFAEVEEALRAVLLSIPNVPHPDAVVGTGDHENPVRKGPVNMPQAFADWQRVPHWETGRH